MADTVKLDAYISHRAARERARALRQATAFSVLGTGLALFALLLFNGACLLIILGIDRAFDADIRLANPWLWLVLNAVVATWIAIDTWRRPFPEVLRATFGGPNQTMRFEFMPKDTSLLIRHPVGWAEKIVLTFRNANEIFFSGPHIIKDALGEYLLYRRLQPRHVEGLRRFLEDLMKHGGRWTLRSDHEPESVYMAPLAMHLGLVLKVESSEGPQLKISRAMERGIESAQA